MKALTLVIWFIAFGAFANESLERDYVGMTDNNAVCTVRFRDSEGSASFHYREGGDSKACGFSYDRYYLTNQLDDGHSSASIKDKSGFRSCKLQVYFTADGQVKRLRMGQKSILSPFYSYKDCKLP